MGQGYRTAEVTFGGVDTHELSSRTMGAQRAGLYFIGGDGCHRLAGGYNFRGHGRVPGHARRRWLKRMFDFFEW
jgi:predicted flavoprotein YhiN